VCTLLAQLRQALLQRLHPQRIPQHHTAEQLGCEVGDAGELQILALGEGVPMAMVP